MDLFRKISLIFGLTVLAITIFLVGYLQIFLLTFTDYGLIKEFPDSQSKFYDEGEYLVTDRKLTNTERDKVIIPNDELMYSFKVHNLKDYRANIDYELEFFKGGVREEPIYSGSDQLEPKSNEVQVIKQIYLKTSGAYDIKLNLFYRNSTGEKYAQYSPGFEDIELLSKVEQLQIEQNDNFLKGITVSAFIGVGTILALAFSVYFSRKEVNHLEKQAKTENRPWLGATTAITIKRNPLQLIFHYKNYGKFPANNVKEKHLFSSEMLSKEEYQTRLAERTVPHTSIVLPDQEADLTIGGIPEQISNRFSNSESIFLAIIIDYTFSENKKGQYGVIFEYLHSDSIFTVRKEWAE